MNRHHRPPLSRRAVRGPSSLTRTLDPGGSSGIKSIPVGMRRQRLRRRSSRACLTAQGHVTARHPSADVFCDCALALALALALATRVTHWVVMRAAARALLGGHVVRVREDEDAGAVRFGARPVVG